MIRNNTIDRVGFVTLTFKENLVCRREAQRRFNSLSSNFLRPRLHEFVTAVERQGRGAIHYHLVCAFKEDIRTGFDFESCTAANVARKNGDLVECRRLQTAYYRTANPALRAWWYELRKTAEVYGFGRCETLPVLSNSAAISRYVGAYVGIEVANRQARDKGMRTIRYSLKQRTASMNFQWANGAGKNWRMGCAVLSAILATDDFTGCLGKSWGHNWAKTIAAFGRHFDNCMLAAQQSISDHKTTPERVAAASRLAEYIEKYEAQTLSPA